MGLRWRSRLLRPSRWPRAAFSAILSIPTGTRWYILEVRRFNLLALSRGSFRTGGARNSSTTRVLVALCWIALDPSFALREQNGRKKGRGKGETDTPGSAREARVDRRCPPPLPSPHPFLLLRTLLEGNSLRLPPWRPTTAKRSQRLGRLTLSASASLDRTARSSAT